MKIDISKYEQDSLEMIGIMVASDDYDREVFLTLAAHFTLVMASRYQELKKSQPTQKPH
jgi:hypothetical protein